MKTSCKSCLPLFYLNGFVNKNKLDPESVFLKSSCLDPLPPPPLSAFLHLCQFLQGWRVGLLVCPGKHQFDSQCLKSQWHCSIPPDKALKRKRLLLTRVNSIHHRCRWGEVVHEHMLPVWTSMWALPCTASGVRERQCPMVCFWMALCLFPGCSSISAGSDLSLFQGLTIIHIFRSQWLKPPNKWIHTYWWNDILGIGVSPNNTAVIHYVSINKGWPSVKTTNSTKMQISFWKLN